MTRVHASPQDRAVSLAWGVPYRVGVDLGRTESLTSPIEPALEELVVDLVNQDGAFDQKLKSVHGTCFG